MWRVTQAAFPLMRAAGAGRIVTITSIGGLIGQAFNDAYCAAKFAVEGFMESLVPVAQRMGVQVVLVEPGPVNTEFVASVRSKAQASGTELEAYRPLREAYLAAAAQAFASIGQTGSDIANIIADAADAADAKTPHFRYATSDMIGALVGRKYVDPTGDSILALVGARLP